MQWKHFILNLSKITRSYLQKIEFCNESEYGLWIHFEDIDDGLLRCFYAQENSTFFNQSKLAFTAEDMVKLKKVLNKTHVCEMRTRYRVRKMEILQVDKLNSFRCSTQKQTYRLQRCSLTGTLFDESESRFSNF